MNKTLKMVIILLACQFIPLYAQFSSGIDYVEYQKKIDEYKSIGVNLSIANSSFDWKINQLKNTNSALFNDSLLNCEIGMTTSNFAAEAFYTEKNKQIEYQITADISSFDRSADIKIIEKDSTFSQGFDNFELWQYGINGNLKFIDQPYFLSGKAKTMTYKVENLESGTFYLYFEPGYQLFKDKVNSLSIAAGAAFFDDNYAGLTSKFLYLTEIPDQFAAIIKYDWQNREHSAGASYKFGMLPNNLYSTGDYSNFETRYKFKLQKHHLAVGLIFGVNFEHNIDHLAEPVLTMPIYYYTLRFEGDYLDNKLLLGVDWHLSSINTSLSDDQIVMQGTQSILNCNPLTLKNTGGNNDLYTIKLSIGYKL